MKTLKYIGFAGLVLFMAACDKNGNTLTGGTGMIAKSDSSGVDTLYLDHNEDTVCVVVVETVGDSASVKWKKQPRTGEETDVVAVAVIDGDVTASETLAGVALSVSSTSTYQFLPSGNPSNVSNFIPGTGVIKIDCVCSFKLQPDDDCSENLVLGKDGINITCIKEPYCRECKAETKEEKIVHWGAGLLIKANKINVIPL